VSFWNPSPEVTPGSYSVCAELWRWVLRWFPTAAAGTGGREGGRSVIVAHPGGRGWDYPPCRETRSNPQEAVKTLPPPGIQCCIDHGDQDWLDLYHINCTRSYGLREPIGRLGAPRCSGRTVLRHDGIAMVLRHVDTSAACVSLIVTSENVCICTVRLFIPISLTGKLHAASVTPMSVFTPHKHVITG
jgi:hypothetical protein